MNRRKLLKKLSEGSFNNVSFRDAQSLIEGFGFSLVRVNGSHHIYSHQEIDAMINLQHVNGEAKQYQLKQLIRIIERNNLMLED